MLFSELIRKYDLRPNSYVFGAESFDYKYWFEYLFYKWESFIAEGHYGFDGLAANEVFFRVIDEMLEIIKENSPQFRIEQIKVKLGGIRINLTNISDEVFDGIRVMEEVLYDESLIY